MFRFFNNTSQPHSHNQEEDIGFLNEHFGTGHPLYDMEIFSIPLGEYKHRLHIRKLVREAQRKAVEKRLREELEAQYNVSLSDVR